MFKPHFTIITRELSKLWIRKKVRQRRSQRM